MKKLLFSLSLLASLATFAGESTVDSSAQVYGVLPVYSTDTDVIVSVPWVAMANTETNNISVADIIKTANLTVDDWIRVWDDTNKKFKVWNLQEVEGVKTWVAGNTVNADGTDAGTNSADTYLTRGQALILHRQSAATTPTFYVCGQYLSSGATGITCAKASDVGGKLVKAYTLIAPPKTTATAINGLTWKNVGETGASGDAGDYLSISVTKTIGGGTFTVPARLYYKNKTWQSSSGTDDYSIPAGTGIWYTSVVTNESASAASVAW